MVMVMVMVMVMSQSTGGGNIGLLYLLQPASHDHDNGWSCWAETPWGDLLNHFHFSPVCIFKRHTCLSSPCSGCPGWSTPSSMLSSTQCTGISLFLKRLEWNSFWLFNSRNDDILQRAKTSPGRFSGRGSFRQPASSVSSDQRLHKRSQNQQKNMKTKNKRHISETLLYFPQNSFPPTSRALPRANCRPALQFCKL